MRYVAFVTLGLAFSIIVQVIFVFLSSLFEPFGAVRYYPFLNIFLGFLAAWDVTLRRGKRSPGMVDGIVLGTFAGPVVFLSLSVLLPESPIFPTYLVFGIPGSLAVSLATSLAVGPSKKFVGGFLGALVGHVVGGLLFTVLV